MIVAPSHGPLVIDIPPSLLKGKFEAGDLPPDQPMNQFAERLNQEYPGLNLPTLNNGVDPESSLGTLWKIELHFLEPEGAGILYEAEFAADWKPFPDMEYPDFPAQSLHLRVLQANSAPLLDTPSSRGSITIN